MRKGSTTVVVIAGITAGLSLVLAVFSLGLAIRNMHQHYVYLKQYTGIGHGVYAPGTVMDVNGQYKGKLVKYGVWQEAK